MTVRSLLRAWAILVLATACVSCGGGGSAALDFNGISPYGNTFPHQPVGVPTVVGGIVPCTHGGPVTVRSMAATEPRGLTVEAWGSRPNPMARGQDGTGGAFTTLQAIGFAVGGARVVHRCGNDSDALSGLEVAVQVRWTSEQTVWTRGITVAYVDSHGVSGSFVVPTTLVLCGTGAPPEPLTCAGQASQ
jgi:hypothetical protein